MNKDSIIKKLLDDHQKILEEGREEREHAIACLESIRNKPKMSKETERGIKELKDLIESNQDKNEETHRHLDENSASRHDETNHKLSKFFYWFIGTVITIGGMIVGGNYLINKDLWQSNKESFLLMIENHGSRIQKLEDQLTKFINEKN